MGINNMKKNQIIKICNMLLLGFILCLFIFYIIRMYLFRDFPAEYRDAAVLEVIDDFSKGINPYDSNYLNTDEAPRVILDSGFLNVFPAVVMVKFTSISPMMAMYLLNFLYIVMSMFLMYRSSVLLTKNETFSLIAAILEFFCMRRGGLLCVRPDTMAGVLMLLDIYIILRCLENGKKIIYQSTREKNKKLDVAVILLAFFTVLIFFLKPHYAVIALSVFLFVVSQKRGVLFCSNVFVFMGLSIVICSFCFPTHISVWGVRLWEMFSGVGNGKVDNLAYMFQKWIRIIKLFFPIFLGLLCGVSLYVYYIVRGERKIVNSQIKFLAVNSMVNSIVLCYVGRHAGADLWYFFFMLMPSVILLGIYSVSKLLYYMGIRDEKRSVYYALFASFCLISLFRTFNTIVPREENIEQWIEGQQEAYEIIKEHESANMMLSSHLAYYATEHGIYNFNHGDLCYVPTTRVNGTFLENIFPYTDVYINKYHDYAEDVVRKIDDKAYSLITTDEIDVPFYNFGISDEFMNALSKNYRVLNNFSIYNETQVINTTFWIPKE